MALFSGLIRNKRPFQGVKWLAKYFWSSWSSLSRSGQPNWVLLFFSATKGRPAAHPQERYHVAMQNGFPLPPNILLPSASIYPVPVNWKKRPPLILAILSTSIGNWRRRGNSWNLSPLLFPTSWRSIESRPKMKMYLLQGFITYFPPKIHRFAVNPPSLKPPIYIHIFSLTWCHHLVRMPFGFSQTGSGTEWTRSSESIRAKKGAIDVWKKSLSSREKTHGS